MSLAEVEIFGGSAHITDSAAGRAWEVTEANGVIAADSLHGPAKIDGSLVIDGAPFDVSAALGTNAGFAIPAKITAGSHRLPIVLTADGSLDWSESGALKYLADVTIAGAPAEEGTDPAPAIWDDLQAKGTVEITRDALAIAAAQLTYGATERPLVFDGSGRIDLGDAPSFDLNIEARQIDLAGAISGGTRPAADIAAELAALLEEVRAILPGRVHLSAQGVAVRGGLVQAVRADIATAPQGWRVDNASATLPGDTRVEADGMLGPLDTPAFQGHARIASSRPAALAAWWRGASGSAASLGSFAIESDVDVSAESQTFGNLIASIGEGSARGSIAFYRFREPDAVAGEAATHFADVTLTADRLDAIEARALTELFAGDSALSGHLNHVTLSLRADVLSAGDTEARSVVLDGGIEGDELQIRQLSVADLAGAAISASGTLTGPFSSPTGSLEAKFDADDLTGAASFISRVLPENAAAVWLNRVAPQLSPALADVSVRLGGEAGEHAFDITGSFAETHIALNAMWAGTPRSLGDVAGRVVLHLDGADSAAVLRQFGVEALPIESGPLVVDATLDGRLTSDASLALTGTMAGISFDYQAQATGGDETLAGAFSAESADTSAALLLTGLAPPGLGEVAARVGIRPARAGAPADRAHARSGFLRRTGGRRLARRVVQRRPGSLRSARPRKRVAAGAARRCRRQPHTQRRNRGLERRTARLRPAAGAWSRPPPDCRHARPRLRHAGGCSGARFRACRRRARHRHRRGGPRRRRADRRHRSDGSRRRGGRGAARRARRRQARCAGVGVERRPRRIGQPRRSFRGECTRPERRGPRFSDWREAAPSPSPTAGWTRSTRGLSRR